MASIKSLNHKYLLVKFVSDSKPEFKIVRSSRILSCNNPNLDEELLINFSDKIRPCSIISTSNDAFDLEFQTASLKYKFGLNSAAIDAEDVKPDINFIVKIKDEPNYDVIPNAYQQVNLQEGTVKEEDFKPDVNLIKEESGADGEQRIARRSTKRKRIVEDLPPNDDEDEEYMIFGPNATLIKKSIFQAIEWKSYTLATRKLLTAFFTKQTLATHSLTGKRSNAHMDKILTARPQLDENIIQDIIHIVMEKSNQPATSVRRVITSKCCDEHTIMKNRLRKKVKLEKE